MTAKHPTPNEMRWKVRLELSRSIKFGENPRSVLRWGVTPHRGGFPTTRPTFFKSLVAAHTYARRQMRMTYGGPN